MTERWSIEGTYFEACNCEVICPCRQVGTRRGGLSTYGHCDFALSWQVRIGHAGSIDLGGRQVVLVGRYHDDPRHGPVDEIGLWTVSALIDEDADDDQFAALADIILGRAGGQTLTNFAGVIGTVHEVRRARIELDHRPGSPRMSADDAVLVRALQPVDSEQPVSCGIPGIERPGVEYRVEAMTVATAQMQWSVTGRCGFAADYAYAGP